MQGRWTYSVGVQEDRSGDFVVSVRDLPEVVTSGSSLPEALALAADAIEVAVTGRMKDDMDLSEPAELHREDYRCPPAWRQRPQSIPPGRKHN